MQKFTRIVSLVLVSILIVFLMIGFSVDEIRYRFSIDLQAPVYKSYHAYTGHDMKRDLYHNILLEGTEINDFSPGNRTSISYIQSGKKRKLIEEIIALDSLEYVEMNSTFDDYMYSSKLNFIDKNKVTRLKIEESVSTTGFMDRAFLFLFQYRIKKQREKYYERTKQIIESTPDELILPEELDGVPDYK